MLKCRTVLVALILLFSPSLLAQQLTWNIPPTYPITVTTSDNLAEVTGHADRITSVWGVESIPIMQQPGLNDFMAYVDTYSGDYIVYDPALYDRIVVRYGEEAAIGLLAHEVGHVVQGILVNPMFADWTDETQADFFAGMTLVRLGLSSTQLETFFRAEAVADSRHPDGATRATNVNRGYADNGVAPVASPPIAAHTPTTPTPLAYVPPKQPSADAYQQQVPYYYQVPTHPTYPTVQVDPWSGYWVQTYVYWDWSYWY